MGSVWTCCFVTEWGLVRCNKHWFYDLSRSVIRTLLASKASSSVFTGTRQEGFAIAHLDHFDYLWNICCSNIWSVKVFFSARNILYTQNSSNISWFQVDSVAGIFCATRLAVAAIWGFTATLRTFQNFAKTCLFFEEPRLCCQINFRLHLKNFTLGFKLLLWNTEGITIFQTEMSSLWS